MGRFGDVLKKKQEHAFTNRKKCATTEKINRNAVEYRKTIITTMNGRSSGSNISIDPEDNQRDPAARYYDSR